MQTKDISYQHQQDYQMARARDTDIVLTKPPSIAWSKIFSCCRPPPSSKVLTVDNRIVKDDDCNSDIQVMSTSCHQYHIDPDKPTIDADKSYSSISLSYSIDKSMRGDSSAVKVKHTSVLDSLKKSIIFEEENDVLMLDGILDERDDELLQGGRGDSIQCSREETTGVETLQRKITSLETDLANKSSEVDRLRRELETAAFLSSITEEEAMRKEIGIILNKMKWMKHDVEQLQSENSNLYKLNKAKSAEIDELKKEKKKAYDSIILLSTQLQLLNDAKIERDLLEEENTSMLEKMMHQQDQIDRLHSEREYSYESLASLRIELNGTKESNTKLKRLLPKVSEIQARTCKNCGKRRGRTSI